MIISRCIGASKLWSLQLDMLEVVFIEGVFQKRLGPIAVPGTLTMPSIHCWNSNSALLELVATALLYNTFFNKIYKCNIIVVSRDPLRISGLSQ